MDLNKLLAFNQLVIDKAEDEKKSLALSLNIDYEEYKDKNEYIEEVQSINHLTEEDSIRAGQTLIVPYYSYDFVK